MGTLFNAQCTNCGYQAQLNTGGSMWDCKPAAALTAVGESADLSAALEAGLDVRIERVPAVCHACGEIMTGVRATWSDQAGAVHVVTRPCPRCGGELTFYPADTGEVVCPVCGKGIPLRLAGYWD